MGEVFKIQMIFVSTSLDVIIKGPIVGKEVKMSMDWNLGSTNIKEEEEESARRLRSFLPDRQKRKIEAKRRKH